MCQLFKNELTLLGFRFLPQYLVESVSSVNYVSVNYSVKYSTADCKYLLFLPDFFFRLKTKQYDIADCLKTTSENL